MKRYNEGSRIWERIEGPASNQMWGLVKGKVRHRVAFQVREWVFSRLSNHNHVLESNMRQNVEEQVGHLVLTTWTWVESGVWYRVRDQVRNKVGDEKEVEDPF